MLARMFMLASLLGSVAAQVDTTCDGPCSVAFQSDSFCIACATDGKLVERMDSYGPTNNACTLKQPFFKSPTAGWIQMTIGDNGLDYAVTNDQVGKETFIDECNVDYSGLAGDGTGSISSTQTTESGNLEVKRTWSLASKGSTGVSLNVEIKNVGSTSLTNIGSYFGTRDDYVGDDDGPQKSPALVSSSGVDLDVTGGNAVVVKSGNEAVMIYSPSPDARGLYASCCEFENVVSIENPATWTSSPETNDGAYAVYANAGDLAPGASTTVSYTYAVGAPTPEALNAVAREAVTGAVAAPVSGEIFDDPHVRTLSGNQFFLHGVGVFDYATIPGVIKTQVYMCPFAECTSEMAGKGECLTFIQAVAVQINGAKKEEHTIILRNNSVRVDRDDRANQTNITFGSGTVLKASGSGGGAAHPNRNWGVLHPARVNHDTLATCHVLDSLTGAQVFPKEYTDALKLRQAKGMGAWQNCTRNEWTLHTPDVTIDIGVIGPFEEGYLREEVSDRTFNLAVKWKEWKPCVKESQDCVTKMAKFQGIINGDKNGLFQLDPLDPTYTDEAQGKPLVPGALVPFGPHGMVQEVTAPNVPAKDVLFTKEAMAKMDKLCGAQQSLRAIRLAEGDTANTVSDEQMRGWKAWKQGKPGRRAD